MTTEPAVLICSRSFKTRGDIGCWADGDDVRAIDRDGAWIVDVAGGVNRDDCAARDDGADLRGAVCADAELQRA